MQQEMSRREELHQKWKNAYRAGNFKKAQKYGRKLRMLRKLNEDKERGKSNS